MNKKGFLFLAEKKTEIENNLLWIILVLNWGNYIRCEMNIFVEKLIIRVIDIKVRSLEFFFTSVFYIFFCTFSPPFVCSVFRLYLKKINWESGYFFFFLRKSFEILNWEFYLSNSIYILRSIFFWVEIFLNCRKVGISF